MLTSFIGQMEENRDPEKAAAMKKYMKDLFPFFGIKAPERKNISKDFIKEFNAVDDYESYVKELWELPEREYQYVAIDFLIKKKKNLDESHIDFIEYLIVTKSWWDTVDAIASHLAGTIFSKHPELIEKRGEKWLNSDNIWLKRTMILFQLKYKERTNDELLFSIIERTKHIDEFFIQKAIGWILREYSKTSPDAVNQFIESNELSNLAKREGLKYIQKAFP
ncbi:DNA-7-methylguanine glycosylase [Bacillus freudenreichii]|nr:DNA-7-methylguanine glycosylase [Bacillus freudenreichii]